MVRRIVQRTIAPVVDVRLSACFGSARLLAPSLARVLPVFFWSPQLVVNAVRARTENSRGPCGETHLLTDLAVVWEGAHERVEAD